MPVDTNWFLRYPGGSVRQRKDESLMNLFDVLEAVRRLSRVGGICTAALVASETSISTYLSRKVLHTAHDIGLVDWEVKDHRPNVQKRIYKLTDRGLAVVNAYYDGVLWDTGGQE